MRTLEIEDLPDEVYQQIQKLARLHRRTVSEQAPEFLSRGLAHDQEREDTLLEEIRIEREALAKRGVRITSQEIKAARERGRA